MCLKCIFKNPTMRFSIGQLCQKSDGFYGSKVMEIKIICLKKITFVLILTAFIEPDYLKIMRFDPVSSLKYKFFLCFL